MVVTSECSQFAAGYPTPVAIEFFTPWGSLETRVSGSGVSLDSWRLFETEGIPMDDGDQAVVSALTVYVDDTRRRAARIRQRHDWGSTSSAPCLQQITSSRPGVVYERFPMLCDLDGCHMWLGDRKNQLPTTLTAEDEPRRNLQAKDIVVAV